MKTNYTPAADVEKIAQDLIRDYHRHLLNARVVYLFIDKTPMKGGREVWATARLTSGLAAFLAGETDPDGPGALFCIVVAQQVWSYLPQGKKVALIDHELCHLFVDVDAEGNDKYSLVGHDLEEFTSVVKRHGAWRQEVDSFLQMAAQAEPGLLDEQDEAA